MLSVAISILVSERYSSNELIIYADNLLRHFIKNCINIYGSGFVTLNVHSLIHLTDCVRRFGKLDHFSSFKFENSMPCLTRKVRKSSLTIQQVVRRTIEERNQCKLIINRHKTEKFSFEHFSGPLINNCNSPQFKVYSCSLFTINVSKTADRFVELKDSSIIEIVNFATWNAHVIE